MQAFTYMGIAFSLLTTEKVIRYYRSIYFVFHITAGLALIAGLVLKNILRKPKTEKEN